MFERLSKFKTLANDEVASTRQPLIFIAAKKPTFYHKYSLWIGDYCVRLPILIDEGFFSETIHHIFHWQSFGLWLNHCEVDICFGIYSHISFFGWNLVKISIGNGVLLKCSSKVQQIMELVFWKYFCLIFHFELMMDGLVASINL
jgi:hypothetical protein